MSYRQTIATFSAPRICGAAIDTLLAGFKSAHKRGASVDLFLSVTSESPDPRARSLYSIRIYADDPILRADEIKWFANAALSL